MNKLNITKRKHKTTGMRIKDRRRLRKEKLRILHLQTKFPNGEFDSGSFVPKSNNQIPSTKKQGRD